MIKIAGRGWIVVGTKMSPESVTGFVSGVGSLGNCRDQALEIMIRVSHTFLHSGFDRATIVVIQKAV